MLNEIDLSRADLNLLVLFEVVLEERHVGRAAERLNLTPSAVSHGLGRLRRLLNDPLFLRTPKGVVPTARATELAAPIADILARVRSVISTAEPFDPARSTRRFTIGAPDGVSAVFLPPLLAELRRTAPGIDISVRQLLPTPGEASPERAWRSAFADLEARAMDIAIIPSDRHPGALPRANPLRGGFRRRGARRTSVRGRSDPGSILRDAASGGLAHRRSRMASSIEVLAERRLLAADCADRPELHVRSRRHCRNRPDLRAAETVRRHARAALRGRRPGSAASVGSVPAQRRSPQGRDDGYRPGLAIQRSWKSRAGCAEASQGLAATKTAFGRCSSAARGLRRAVA